MARIGIFGGSFNPVHNGHVVMAVEAVELGRLDRLLVVPAATSPHKVDQDSLPAAERVALISLAFAGIAAVEISDLELRRGGVSYTIDTVRELRGRYPSDELLLLVGADSVGSLRTWREHGALARACSLLVAIRPGFPLPPPAGEDNDPSGFRMELLETTPVGISSSQVRERAAAGRTLRGFVPDPVAERIRSEGLFRRG
jgi:nicotinate-nucleotide adenylyltransferase